MKTFALIVDGMALQCVDLPEKQDLTKAFHPQALAEYGGIDAFTEVPYGTKHGARSDGNGGYTNPVAPSPLLKWDALDFKRRFTQAERINIHTLAQSNMQALDFLDLLNTAAATGTMIHSTDPDVIAGLEAFETAELLAPGRAAEILGA